MNELIERGDVTTIVISLLLILKGSEVIGW